MARGKVRWLTSGEIALARAAFGDAIPYGRVRIRDGAGGNPAAWLAFRTGNSAITLRRTIHYGRGWLEDFSVGEARDKALFLHEMTHVWQYARLGTAPFLLRYAGQFLACGGKARLMYLYDADTARFERAMLEAQAQMVGDYCAALLAGDEDGAAKLAGALAGSGLYGF